MAIMVAKEAENSICTARLLQITTRVGFPTLKWPTFNWRTPNKYQELCNLETEAKTF